MTHAAEIVVGLFTFSACALGVVIGRRSRAAHTPRYMSELPSPAAFRANIRSKYAEEFRLHREVAEALEPFVAGGRSLPTNAHIALDMLMTQSYKTHFAVRLLSERAQAEDAATLTRRLMELAIQAIYIGCDDDPTVVEARAGSYLAWLWRSLPDDLKVRLPEPARLKWQAILDQYGSILPKAKRWGPQFREMFEFAGLLDAYEQDYSLLSAMAHGSTREAMLHYSMPVVQIRPDLPVPILLIYSTRYYLGVADAWNRHFKTLDSVLLADFILRVVELRDAKPSPPAS